MTLKTLLLHLDNGAAFGRRLDVALALAARHKAALVALSATPLPMLPVGPADAAYLSAELIERMMADQRQAAERQVAQVRQRAATTGTEVSAVIRQGAPSFALIDAAATADLVVLGQPDPDAPGPADYALVADVVMGGGRPVLCVPYAGDHTGAGAKILVAWNGTPPAARAVHDALPLLKAAKQVTIAAVGDLPEGKTGPDGLREHLARHGIAAAVKTIPVGTLDPGNALLDAVSDFGADLMVMGAYGHSRLREFVLGGTSKTILQSMTVPVLLSH